MKITKIMQLGIVFILCFIPGISHSLDCGICECCFDSPDYKANGKCDLTCTVYMDTPQQCSIVCDGSARNVSSGDVKIFGSSSTYLMKMNRIRENLHQNGFQTFKNMSGAISTLPMLLRSGYIGQSFVSPDVKKEIDKQIHMLFQSDGTQVVHYFNGSRRGVMDKTLRNGIRIRATFKKIYLYLMNERKLFMFFMK